MFVLLAARNPHILTEYMAAASIMPIGDGVIGLRHNGSKATAYGVHRVTAAVMLTTAAVLSTGPS